MGVGALKSVQETNRTAVPVVMNKPIDGYGKLRRIFFNYVVAGSDVADGTTIDLCRIPAGCRLFGGVIKTDDGFAGAAAVMDIGNATTPAKYLDDGDVSGAADLQFGHTLALNYGEEITTEFTLVAKVTADVLIAGGLISGYAEIVVE